MGVAYLGHIPIDPKMVIRCDAGTPFVTDPEPSAVKTAFIRLSQEIIKAMDQRAAEIAAAVHSDLEK
jgi:hypothetical protein